MTSEFNHVQLQCDSSLGPTVHQSRTVEDNDSGFGAGFGDGYGTHFDEIISNALSLCSAATDHLHDLVIGGKHCGDTNASLGPSLGPATTVI